MSSTKDFIERLIELTRISRSNNLLKLSNLKDLLCPNFEPTFDGQTSNYFIYYDHLSSLWNYDDFLWIDIPGVIYFDSEENAQKVCNVLNKR